ncbi:hypothetical protein QYM36_006945 [Artemia franciscana]|uniref:Uncharacterized protein n=1 Tax=Artemia franciscana TaxID=6661 RepID=A0AA88HRL3_ARTSF|nr:hypothetical protein QYM36_006945 [Artemia franciscana]
MLISRKAAISLISWTPVNGVVMFARFHGHHTEVTVVVCYAPTNGAEELVKERFYDTRNSVSKHIQRHDMVKFHGDFDTKAGNGISYCPEVLGPCGIGDRNENGALLIDFASINVHLTCGTEFRHKNIHKYTWTSPDGKTRNQIDHFLINDDQLSKA